MIVGFSVKICGLSAKMSGNSTQVRNLRRILRKLRTCAVTPHICAETPDTLTEHLLLVICCVSIMSCALLGSSYLFKTMYKRPCDEVGTPKLKSAIFQR